MLFDVQAALADILSDTPQPAISAIPAIPPKPNSGNSGNSDRRQHETERGEVAPFAPMPSPPEPACHDENPYHHGRAFTGDPKTWTGRVVSLDAWRRLSEWERHGPDGRHWNGRSQQWEQPGGGSA